MREIVAHLLRLGFKEQDAKIYVALLGSEKATAGALSKQTGIARGTVYDVLTSFVQKGLVMEVRDRERVFLAQPPEKIRSMFSEQARELDYRRQYLDRVMGEFDVYHQSSQQQPKVRYIETIEGWRTLQAEYEAKQDEIIQILNYDRFCELRDPVVSRRHLEDLKEHKRRIRSIFLTERMNVEIPEDFDVVLLPHELAHIKGEMTVCSDSVVFFSYEKKMIAVEIVSTAIASVARATLELAWAEAMRVGTFHRAK